MKNNAVVVVRTTVRNKTKAKELARLLVESKLASCTQYFAVESIYRWNGKVESAREYAVEAKTRASGSACLVETIRDWHDYELPEIVVIPISGGLQDYVRWVYRESKAVEFFRKK